MMTKIQAHKLFIIMQTIIFSFVASMIMTSPATAAVEHYTLDNIIQDDKQQR